MAKLGHEAPLLDNQETTDSSMDDSQLGMEDGVLQDKPETPVGLRLTEKEAMRVEELEKTHSHDEALQMVIGKKRAGRIIGYRLMTEEIEHIDKRQANRRQEAALPVEEAVRIIKESYPKGTEPGSTDRAA